MKTFIKHDIPNLKTVNSDGKRFYLTENGNKYPSVTSVVSIVNAKKIYEWRQRVGEDAANQISSKASSRGTRIHTLCENYLLGKPTTVGMFDMEAFDAIRPHLDKIDNIHCLEQKLYSDTLRVAGTVDCIADYKGELAIIDFKTSSRIKTKEDIPTYFMQTAAYSQCFEELTGVRIDQLLVLMVVDNERKPLIFKEDRAKWLKEFKSTRLEFYRKNKS